MKIIADLHIHSKFSRACSKELVPENLDVWARKKGIAVLGTGDFTHPGWLSELENKLEVSAPGLYRLKAEYRIPYSFRSERTPVSFMVTGEISSIYKQGDKVRRIHNVVLVPSLEIARQVNEALTDRGANLKSDGRPIVGIHCDELVKILKDVDENIEVVPAHAWTPHFGIFGSLSGFDSLDEAFGDQSKYIFAIETGLSSDPKMNWQVESLDSISLISNSDPHSLHRLGREANVFDIDPARLSFAEIIRVIRNNNPKEFLSTIEFFPEEGRYHLDGHADCGFSCLPEETRRRNGICPVCGKKLLRGVLYRVDELSVREYGYKPPQRPGFLSTIPLEEITAETFAVGVGSKKVSAEYERLVSNETEFAVLFDTPEDELVKLSSKELAQNIIKVRRGALDIVPGYDGLYGQVHIRGASYPAKKNSNQQVLF